MDFSKRVLFPIVLALSLSPPLGGLCASPELPGKSAKVVVAIPKKTPVKVIQHSVKQIDYDKPGYFSYWAAPGVKDKAALLCVHGLGLYSGAFKALGQRLAQRGYPTYSMDVRGFGRYMKTDKTLDFQRSLIDLGEIIKVIRVAHRNVPIVLIGESMGGAIVIQAGALYQKDIAGIIASAPGDLRFKAGKMNVEVGLKLMTRPTKRVDWGDELLSMATSNTKLQEQWRKDPLVRLKMAPTELLKFDSFMGKTMNKSETILSVPMLFLHGGDYELMRVKGTIELFNEIPSTRKDLFILGQREHMMLEEGQFDEKTILLVETWLASSLKVAEKLATAH